MAFGRGISPHYGHRTFGSQTFQTQSNHGGYSGTLVHILRAKRLFRPDMLRSYSQLAYGKGSQAAETST